METFSIENLSDRVGGRYPLVVAAAKRARQLKEGAVPLVKVQSSNLLTVALAEIAAGKVVVKEVGEPGDEPEVKPVARPEEPRITEEDLLGGDLFGISADEDVGQDVPEEEPEPEDEIDDEEEPEIET
ncbi:MAG: DNA-directed RNA polymerase subunit omega [Armatimonadota bacterium]|nr:DNA-directed RNA polymerase subunit omega [Armatimonadota bacterium]